MKARPLIVSDCDGVLLHFLAPVALLAFSILTFAVLPYGRNLVPVELDAAGKPAAQPRAQHRLVRQDFLLEPAIRIVGQRNHGRAQGIPTPRRLARVKCPAPMEVSPNELLRN